MKITLCGSTRFIEQFHAWNRWLALQGHVVYSVAVVTTAVASDVTNDEKETLDLVHLVKILNSDAILVIDCLRWPDDHKYNVTKEKWELLTETYVGESTAREIKWAKLQYKLITYTGSFKGIEFSKGAR
ncbi:hypothetical protein LCGC14_1733360 [marine sediment metagenome]|uniref:Uncharacterized protein n=1 Tax=marine sediment metagenome TaxID=412755 RepID=A0A0F9H8V9_9ZZZZ